MRIAAAIGLVDTSVEPEEVVQLPCARELRLEPWEAAAYQKLFDRRPAEAEEDTEELWMLYLRAAALRLKVDEEATILATAMAAGVRPEAELLTKREEEPRPRERARRAVRRLPAGGGVLREPQDPASAVSVAVPAAARVFGAVADLRSAVVSRLVHRACDSHESHGPNPRENLPLPPPRPHR